MPRGGYRRPNKPAPASGPGKLSRRTDTGPKVQQHTATTKQPVRVPPLQGSASLQYGDVQRLAQSQQMAPVPAAPPAGRASPPSGPAGGLGASMLFRPTDMPQTPIGAPGTEPQIPPGPTQIAMRNLARGLELMMQRLPSVSDELMQVYLALREEELG